MVADRGLFDQIVHELPVAVTAMPVDLEIRASFFESYFGMLADHSHGRSGRRSSIQVSNVHSHSPWLKFRDASYTVHAVTC